MRLAIEIEEQESWPPAFLREAVAHRKLVIDYHGERRRIDKLCELDVAMRVRPPENKHANEYNQLVARLEAILAAHSLVAYHCTRLTREEINAIKSDGMKVLSKELVQRRLDQCFASGHLNAAEHEYLSTSESIGSNLSDDFAHRTGKIWFCPNRSTLQDYLSVHRLFRSWGGEAIYCGHEEDARISITLTRIGSPSIVKCAIPFSRGNQPHQNFSERFLSQSVSDEVRYPEPSAGFDLHTKSDVAASEILDIIEFTDSRFQGLTRYSTWDAHHTIMPR